MTLKTRVAVVGLVLLALVIAPFSALAQDLKQSFISEDGTLTFSYPEGWVAEEFFGTVLVATSQETADQFLSQSTLAPGQGLVMMLTPALVAEELGFTPGQDVETMMALFMQDAPETMSPVETLTIGDWRVARTSGEEDGLMLIVYLVNFGDPGAVLLAQATLPGEEGKLEGTTRAIIATMVVKAPVVVAEIGSVVWQQQFEINREDESATTPSMAGKVQVDADDTIYVLDASRGVHTFGPDGTPRGLLTLEGMEWAPNTFTLAPDGTLWTLDFMNALTQYDLQSGQRLSTIDLSALTEVAYFGVDMAFGPDGNLYVLNPTTDDAGNAIGQMLVLSPAGELLRSFEVGRDDYFFDATFAVGADGQIYLAQRYSDQGIVVFDSTGTMINPGIRNRDMYSLAGVVVLPDGTLYTAVPDSPILHLASDGTVLGRFGTSVYSQENYDYGAPKAPPFDSGAFGGIGGMALLSDGDLIVADATYDWWQLVRVDLSE